MDKRQNQLQEKSKDNNHFLSKLKGLKSKPRLILEIIGIILILSLATASSGMIPKEDYDTLQSEYTSLKEDYNSLQKEYDDAASDLKVAKASLEDTLSE
ncbi:hypothetical protein ACQRBN_05035 [Bariatricus sp. SGI.154]|uniref:hypothetical protein n=1 Tax=Bariatricus sp. SGI.154 TaxID=3420549 RepID=UPI003CFE7CA5